MKAAIYSFLLFVLFVQGECHKNVLNCVHWEEDIEQFDLNPKFKFNDCDAYEKCTLHIGKRFNMTFQFISAISTDAIKLETELIYYADDFELVDLEMSPDDCKSIVGGGCPVKEGKTYQIQTSSIVPDLTDMYGDIPSEGEIAFRIAWVDSYGYQRTTFYCLRTWVYLKR